MDASVPELSRQNRSDDRVEKTSAGLLSEPARRRGLSACRCWIKCLSLLGIGGQRMPFRRSVSRIDTDGVSAPSPRHEPMSEIVTGEAYAKAITSQESDRRARSAFQDL